MKVALLAMLLNEGRTLAEWIGFHAEVGFDSIIVYDNGSTDDILEIISQASKYIDIRLVRWGNGGSQYQTDAYKDAISRFGSEFDWIAILDGD